jgi:hypothetical protein
MSQTEGSIREGGAYGMPVRGTIFPTNMQVDHPPPSPSDVNGVKQAEAAHAEKMSGMAASIMDGVRCSFFYTCLFALEDVLV